MNSEFEQAVTYIKDNLAIGFPPDQLRRQLVQSGWDPTLVDRAFQQATYSQQQAAMPTTAPATAKAGSKKPLLFVLLVLVGVAAVIATFILTSPSNTNQQQSANNTSEQEQEGAEKQQFIHEASGISLLYPEDWELDDLSSDRPDAFYWQLRSPTNDSVAQELEEKYQLTLQPSLDNISSSGLEEALADPLAQQLASVDIKLFRAPTFTIESDLAEWKKVADTVNLQPEFDLTKFQNITVAGHKGLKYESTITLEDTSFTTIEYVVIMPDQRLEVSVFPGVSNQIETVDAVVNSIAVN